MGLACILAYDSVPEYHSCLHEHSSDVYKRQTEFAGRRILHHTINLQRHIQIYEARTALNHTEHVEIARQIKRCLLYTSIMTRRICHRGSGIVDAVLFQHGLHDAFRSTEDGAVLVRCV